MSDNAEFLEIWHEAYELYCTNGKLAMNTYLRVLIRAGILTRGDAETLSTNIIETYNL